MHVELLILIINRLIINTINNYFQPLLTKGFH